MSDLENKIDGILVDYGHGDLARDIATQAIMALIESERAEKEALREAAKAVLRAVDSAKMVETGAGGMTIESQLMRSVYQRVPALPFEWLRDALDAT